VTLDDVDKMEVGQAMDALVATAVMGWKLDDPDVGGWMETDDGKRWVWAKWLSVEPTFELDQEGYEQQRPFYILGDRRFAPSTDITAAWEVVKHLTTWRGERENATRFEFTLYLNARDKWICEFYDFPNTDIDHDTAPLAICRAALKASLASAAERK
jgi:hypothetical protein